MLLGQLVQMAAEGVLEKAWGHMGCVEGLVLVQMLEEISGRACVFVHIEHTSTAVHCLRIHHRRRGLLEGWLC